MPGEKRKEKRTPQGVKPEAVRKGYSIVVDAAKLGLALFLDESVRRELPGDVLHKFPQDELPISLLYVHQLDFVLKTMSTRDKLILLTNLIDTCLIHYSRYRYGRADVKPKDEESPHESTETIFLAIVRNKHIAHDVNQRQQAYLRMERVTMTGVTLAPKVITFKHRVPTLLIMVCAYAYARKDEVETGQNAFNSKTNPPYRMKWNPKTVHEGNSRAVAKNRVSLATLQKAILRVNGKQIVSDAVFALWYEQYLGYAQHIEDLECAKHALGMCGSLLQNFPDLQISRDPEGSRKVLLLLMLVHITTFYTKVYRVTSHGARTALNMARIDSALFEEFGGKRTEAHHSRESTACGPLHDSVTADEIEPWINRMTPLVEQLLSVASAESSTVCAKLQASIDPLLIRLDAKDAIIEYSFCPKKNMSRRKQE